MSEPHAWFFAPELGDAGDSLTLPAREGRHAAGARRLGPGDDVTLFDGRGTVARARVAGESGAHQLVLEVTACERREPTKPLLCLAAALPKGDRQSVMLGMAAQLGIARFTPLTCARSIVKPGGSFRERSERILIEACKQSRQPYVPLIDEPQRPAHVAAEASREGSTVLLAHPGGRPAASIDLAQREKIAVLIGPEGGFTDEEIAGAVEAAAQPVSLGGSILRIETAAAALLAYVRIASAGRTQ